MATIDLTDRDFPDLRKLTVQALGEDIAGALLAAHGPAAAALKEISVLRLDDLVLHPDDGTAPGGHAHAERARRLDYNAVNVWQQAKDYLISLKGEDERAKALEGIKVADSDAAVDDVKNMWAAIDKGDYTAAEKAWNSYVGVRPYTPEYLAKAPKEWREGLLNTIEAGGFPGAREKVEKALKALDRGDKVTSRNAFDEYEDPRMWFCALAPQQVYAFLPSGSDKHPNQQEILDHIQKTYGDDAADKLQNYFVSLSRGNDAISHTLGVFRVTQILKDNPNVSQTFLKFHDAILNATGHSDTNLMDAYNSRRNDRTLGPDGINPDTPVTNLPDLGKPMKEAFHDEDGGNLALVHGTGAAFWQEWRLAASLGSHKMAGSARDDFWRYTSANLLQLDGDDRQAAVDAVGSLYGRFNPAIKDDIARKILDPLRELKDAANASNFPEVGQVAEIIKRKYEGNGPVGADNARSMVAVSDAMIAAITPKTWDDGIEFSAEPDAANGMLPTPPRDFPRRQRN